MNLLSGVWLLGIGVSRRPHLGQAILSSEDGDDTQLLQAWRILRECPTWLAINCMIRQYKKVCNEIKGFGDVDNVNLSPFEETPL